MRKCTYLEKVTSHRIVSNYPNRLPLHAHTLHLQASLQLHFNLRSAQFVLPTCVLLLLVFVLLNETSNDLIRARAFRGIPELS
jgi:hypothetical protein